MHIYGSLLLQADIEICIHIRKAESDVFVGRRELVYRRIVIQNNLQLCICINRSFFPLYSKIERIGFHNGVGIFVSQLNIASNIHCFGIVGFFQLQNQSVFSSLVLADGDRLNRILTGSQFVGHFQIGSFYIHFLQQYLYGLARRMFLRIFVILIICLFCKRCQAAHCDGRSHHQDR